MASETARPSRSQLSALALVWAVDEECVSLSAFGPVILTIAALGAGLISVSPELVELVAGPAYADASLAIPALSGGMVAFGGFVLLTGVVGSSGSTRRVAIGALTGMAAQALAASLLVPELGLAGAGLASLVGYLVAGLLLAISVRRLVTVRSAVVLLGSVVGSALALIGATFMMSAPFPARVIAGITIGLAAVALGAVLGKAMRPSSC